MFTRVVLENGVRIVYEKIPYVRSITIGVWIGTGSRNENKINNGISHFIEHMVFKGTEKRTAKEIAESIDNIGGQLNAFTGKECTCYYTKTLDTHFDLALEVLSDMLFNSKFDQKDIDIERKVILEEIGMYEDSPEELVHDILSEVVWNGNSLGYPILGTQDCLKQVNRDTIKEYIDVNYLPSNSVISIAGNFNEEELISAVTKYFGGWKNKNINKSEYQKVDFISDIKTKEKDIEQVHICAGFEGIEQGNDNLYTLLAINNIFGGGMSSRLFQKIREEKGFVYSIYSYPSSYRDAGLFTIYAGMNPEHLSKVSKLIIEEINELKKHGIKSDELQKSKEQLKGNYILGLESTSSRMNSMGKSELMMEKIYTPEEILQKIDKVNMDSIKEVINQVFNIEKLSFTAVGNIKKDINIKKLFLV
jgi:predicted Zn-dependent peptidase